MSWSTNGGPVPHGRPITPSEIRSVVFTTTRMRLGYDVAEVDSFLDQIEWSMETMLAEINRLQRQIADIDRAHAASLADARATAEQLLIRLGGVVPGAGQFPALGAATAPPSQPKRAAAAPPPVWSPAAAPDYPPTPAGQYPPTPGAQYAPPSMTAPRTPRALTSPPPQGRPAANLPPPPGAGGATGQPYHGFPPPRG